LDVPLPDYSSMKATAHWQDWQWHLRNSLHQTTGALPCRITPYYADLLASLGPGHPLGRTVLPDGAETVVSPGETEDPLAEDQCSPVPGLIHRYPDRCLLLVSNTCATYCRYCTRSRQVGRDRFVPFNQPALDYIGQHPEIRDVIVSGGDPLLLATGRIELLLQELGRIPHLEMVRIGTKVPVVLPQRLTPDLLAVLRRFHPWFSLHFSHPVEITPEVEAACSKLADAGCPLGSQTVLLRGVNDDPEVIRCLMVKLLKMRVRPYYLYQCDPVVGTAHFRTDPQVGVDIIRYLRGRISGYGVPTFVIDAPGGGGKIPLCPDYQRGRDAAGLHLENWQGKTFCYPAAEIT
jgi:lysine 2,3-aminomutase